MTHKYYAEDTEQRKRYFDDQFLAYAKRFAEHQGIPLASILSQITDFTSFKRILGIVWSEDGSLSSYLVGMGDGELKEFFNRNVIQKIIEDKIPADKSIPDKVIQVNNKERRLFVSKIRVKKTGRIISVFAKKGYFLIKGKRREVYRESKGRFAKRV